VQQLQVCESESGPVTKAYKPTATEYSEHTHTDVAGAFSVSSKHTSFKSKIEFINEATGFMTLFGMDNKGQVPAMIKRYFRWVTKQSPAAKI
jgi:hypothetical protein